MPIISNTVAAVAPGASVTWEVTYNPNNTFLPVGIPLPKPLPLTPGFAGVFLQVSNVRSTIIVVAGGAAYGLLCDVTNVATTGMPISHQLVVGFGT
jgi:hypothetical protein